MHQFIFIMILAISLIGFKVYRDIDQNKKDKELREIEDSIQRSSSLVMQTFILESLKELQKENKIDLSKSQQSESKNSAFLDLLNETYFKGDN